MWVLHSRSSASHEPMAQPVSCYSSDSIQKSSCDEEEAMLSLAAHMHGLLQNEALSFLPQSIAAVGIDRLWL
jgi:hypothetical protein